jgi:hypothetical protein
MNWPLLVFSTKKNSIGLSTLVLQETFANGFWSTCAAWRKDATTANHNHQ